MSSDGPNDPTAEAPSNGTFGTILLGIVGAVAVAALGVAIAALVLATADPSSPKTLADQPTMGILPDLQGFYWGNFTYQEYNATSSELEPSKESLNRDIMVRRNANLDRFVAYEYHNNGIPNMGAIEFGQYPGDWPKAILRSGLNASSWEQWTIKDKGKTLESMFTDDRSTADGGSVIWLGTFIKQT